MTISQYQADFANTQAAERGVVEHVRFHLRDMVSTGLPTAALRAVWTNETSMYVNLDELFREVARLLAPAGRYVGITGAHNDSQGAQRSPAVQRIDSRYQCHVHARGEYFTALSRNGLVPIHVQDLTPDTIPYWELRQRCSVATGVEDDFLEAYRTESFHYLLVVAERAA